MSAARHPACERGAPPRVPPHAMQLIELGVHMMLLRHLQARSEVKVRLKAPEALRAARMALAITERIYTEVAGEPISFEPSHRLHQPTRDEVIAELLAQWDHLRGMAILQRRCGAFDDTIDAALASRCREASIRLRWIIANLLALVPLERAVNE